MMIITYAIEFKYYKVSILFEKWLIFQIISVMGGVNFYLRFLCLKISLSLPEKEISLFQTLQVLLDLRVLGNKSGTMYVFEWQGILFIFLFPFMTELDLSPPFLFFSFPWLGISMPVCCMSQKHACLHAQGKATKPCLVLPNRLGD